MRSSLKAIILIGLGLFLYSRFMNGSLLYYINQRFAWLTFIAAIGLFLVGISYRQARENNEQSHDHSSDHVHPPQAGHQHAVPTSALFLIAVPVLLGLLVPPRPLGAAAMSNREVGIGLESVASPGNNLTFKTTGPKNILDWQVAFWQSQDPASFTGQEADVIGFVYRDGRFGDDTFMASRFVVSCCVADAASVGLVVRWPEAASLAEDQWVRVTGRFELGEFEGEAIPILVADTVTPTDPPAQPYLYP